VKGLMFIPRSSSNMQFWLRQKGWSESIGRWYRPIPSYHSARRPAC